MKKTAVAIALSLVAGTATAVEALSGEQFTVSGAIAVGGYTDSSREGRNAYNGGATGFDIFANYENGNIVGQFGGEFDIEDDYGTSDSKLTITDTWVGYKTDFGTASIGYANDTALDAIDGAADQTIEFLWSPDDASDARQVVKFEGNKEGVKYGISYYGDRNYKNNSAERQSGWNGYVGFENDQFAVNAGYEDNNHSAYNTNDYISVDSLYLVNGVAKMGQFAIGSTFAEAKLLNDQKIKLYNASAGYSMDELYLAAGYVKVQNTREAMNFGGSYAFSENTTAMVDIAYHLADLGSHEKGDIESFFKVAYAF